MFAFGKERCDKPRQCIRKQRHHFVEKGPYSQPLIVIGRTVAEAEASIFWSPDAKSQLTGQEPDAGKD